MEQELPYYHDHELIKTAKKIFRYDAVLTKMGWTHDVYFDKTSNTFLVMDFPKTGLHFELENDPPIGIYDYEIMKDDGVTVQDSYRVRVYEI